MEIAMNTSVGNERRHTDRRQAQRRTAGASLDVTRIEHENLYQKVEEVARALHRVEHELHSHGRRITALEDEAHDLHGASGAAGQKRA